MHDNTAGGNVRIGSWSCENFSARRERRIVRRNCAFSESNLTVHASHDLELENWIFYILQMYEFSHSQGQTRTSADVSDTTASPSEADMTGSPRDVAEGPKPESCTATNVVEPPSAWTRG